MRQTIKLAFINRNSLRAIRRLDELIVEWEEWSKEVGKIVDQPYDHNTQSEVFADGETMMQKHEVLQTKTKVFLDNNIKDHGFIVGFDGSHCDRTDLRLKHRVKHRLQELRVLRTCLEELQSEDKMATENYYKKEIVGIFQNANWQELSDLFRRLYDPLSLREFRGYVEAAQIDDYTHRHWLSSESKKGFGELMVSCAGKDWNNFKIKFYDSSDEKRFLALDINFDNNKTVLLGSLDNKDKLNNVFSEIITILDVKIRKTKGIKNGKSILFYNKWWFKLLVAPILAALIAGLILLYFQNEPSNKQKNVFRGSFVSSDVNNSNISGDVVGRDKIIYQPVTSAPARQANIDKLDKIKISKIKINRIIEDLLSVINEIAKEYLEESNRIANDFNARNILTSGIHIKAQMDFAISTKEKIEKLLTKGHRDVEDVLLENFKITNLGEMDEFNMEQKALSSLEEKRIPEIYKQVEETVKNWETKSLKSNHLTKDFKL